MSLINKEVSEFSVQAFQDNALFTGLMTGMRAGVAAVIVDVVMKMSLDVVRRKDPVAIVTMAAAFIAAYFFDVNVIWVILASGVIEKMPKVIAIQSEHCAPFAEAVKQGLKSDH